MRYGLVILVWLLASVLNSARVLADVPIATAGPMTGQYAVFGEQMKRGAELAVKDINAKGGVNGEQLVLKIGDDACDPKQAVAVANQLVNEGVTFVAGHFCSGPSIAASKVYHEGEILMISPASTNPSLTEQGFDNVFRICRRDDVQGIYAANYLVDNNVGSKVAILDDKSAYGKGLADEFKKQLNARGVEEVLYEAITAGDKDFTALITKMKEAGVDLIYLGGYHTEAGLIMRQAREQGLNAKLVSGDALVDKQYWEITGPTGEDTLMTFAPDPRKLPAAADVVAEFKAEGFDPEGYTLYTYAAIQAFAHAANKAGSTESKAVAKALREGSYETVLGTVAFNGKGDVKNPEYVMYAWKDGQYEELGAKDDPRNPAPAMEEQAQGPFWNAWLRRGKKPVDIGTLKPNSPYVLTLDLAAFDFARAKPELAIGGAIGAPLRAFLGKIEDSEAEIYVRPILLGVTAPSGTLPMLLYVDLAKLREPAPELTADYERLSNGELPLDTFADRARAAVDPDGKPYRILIQTGSPGCAAVGFSIWDASGFRPIDQVVVRLRIGGDVSCPIGQDDRSFITGLEALLVPMLREPRENVRRVDAGLHIFEIEGLKAESTSVAVYVQRGDKNFVTNTWQLGQPLIPYLTREQQFPALLKDAQKAIWGGDEYAYLPVASALRKRVFSGASDTDRKEAGNALARLSGLASSDEQRRIIARLVTSKGDPIYLPLRLLAAAKQMTPIQVIQALPQQHIRSTSECVEPWKFALPEQIDEVSDLTDLLAKATRGPLQPWLAEPIVNREDWNHYFNPEDASRRPLRPEGLLVLAHQGGGSLFFKKSEVFDYGDMHRTFAYGSVAVLAACSAAGIDAENQEVLRRLNELGIDTIIAAPYQVDAGYGVRLAVKIAELVAEVRAGKRKTTNVVDLFDEAAAAIADDVNQKMKKDISDMALEFQVFGDQDASLCPAVPGDTP